MAADLVVLGGLVVMQVLTAGNTVLMSYLMFLGYDPLTLVISCSFATFLVLTPLAAYFERDSWPTKVTFMLLLQMILISFTGVTLFQSLYLKGTKLTSPAMATAMPNLAPGFIFLIAWICRLERVDISCTYSKVKIAGALLCVIGAITMSLLHSTATDYNEEVNSLTNIAFDKQKITGCLYLMGAIFIMSSNVVLQAITLSDFPAPISLSAITSLIGMFLTAIVQLFDDQKLKSPWPSVALSHLIGYSLLGGTISGTCVSFHGWALKKRGPVLVSMFCPVGTVCSVMLSVISLGETFSLGSVAGMCLMFTGLYFVLWAKGKENYPYGNGLESDKFDAEKPLLS